MSPKNRGLFETLNHSPVIGTVNNKLLVKIFLLVATYVAIFSITITLMSPQSYELEPGDILSAPIRATRDLVDEQSTQRKIDTAVSAVLPVYVLIENVESQVIEKVAETFMEITEIRELVKERETLLNTPDTSINVSPAPENNLPNAGVDETELPTLEEAPELFTPSFISELRNVLSMQLSESELLTAATVDQQELEELKIQIQNAITETMALRIKQENLLEAQSSLREKMMRLPLSNDLRLLGATIGVSVIRPNMSFDNEATELEKSKAAEAVEEVIYREGQYVAQAGQPITAHQIYLLSQLGLLDQVNFSYVFGVGLVILFIYIVVILYFMYFEKEISDQPALLFMLSLITCLALALSYFTSAIDYKLVPYALAGMLITVLLNYKIAIIVNLALAALVGLLLESGLNSAVLSAITGMLGIYMATKMQTRNSLFLVGLTLGSATMLLMFGMELILLEDWIPALRSSLWGIGSGMLSAILTVGTMPIWENLFGVITPIRLVELSNPNTPLLKRMLTEAPGTYHHSIIVANLAESASDAIGANGLLARVGAYYHDVGKLKRPHYFKENMISSENPHDKIDPVLSTSIITTHSKDGIEIAKKYRIPRILHEFISSHHGTSLVTYFYHKAKTINEKDTKLDDFRHLGPKPRTLEAAIVMMADTVEAAVRALPEPNPAKVEALIRKLLKDKLEDGQLDDCHLTLKDISSIATAFTNVICGIFHERVEYPEVNIKEELKKTYDN